MSEDYSVVSEGKVVVFHYTLTDDEGEVVETSKDRGQPLPYLHGAGKIVPGLEEAMEGKTVGDTFDVEVSPEKGYGEKSGPGPQPVDRSEFPDEVDLYEGMGFTAETEDGNHLPLWISSIEGDDIYVDQNHPLAGETLYFDVEIIDVRDATDEEIAHGHAHGVDGQQGH